MKQCKTCRWSSITADDVLILCKFPLPVWLLRELHNPLTGGGPMAATMNRYDGDNCPTYEEKS